MLVGDWVLPHVPSVTWCCRSCLVILLLRMSRCLQLKQGVSAFRIFLDVPSLSRGQLLSQTLTGYTKGYIWFKLTSAGHFIFWSDKVWKASTYNQLTKCFCQVSKCTNFHEFHHNTEELKRTLNISISSTKHLNKKSNYTSTWNKKQWKYITSLNIPVMWAETVNTAGCLAVWHQSC